MSISVNKGFISIIIIHEPSHDKTNNMVFVTSEDSHQPGHPPNLIRVFAVRLVGS